MKKIALTLFMAVLFASCTKSVDLGDQQSDLSIQPKNQAPIATPVVPAGSVQGVQATAKPIAPNIPGPQDALQPAQRPTQQEPQTKKTAYATIVTAKGSITLVLYGDKAPKTVTNFIQKSQSNYYNNLIFHRVEDWVIQGGDPLGTGTGGGQMPTELNTMPFKLGSLGVARGGNIAVSNDSQFFICTDDCSHLTNQYTNFGEVIEGLEVAQSIAKGDVIQSIVIDIQ